MRLFVAVTDTDWFALHASKPDVEEVNFWKPSPEATFKVLQPGELLLFKLHAPDNFIVGGGFFTKGGSLHITNSQGDQKLSEIECKPTGAECEGTASGKKAKVTMYFSGPTLVQLETVGSDVIKRQFTVREQPDIMELEVIPIIGSAKSETLHLKRMPRSPGSR